MMRGLPSITTTVSSDCEIGLNHAYNPAARTSSARVKFLHLSKSATCCRVSVLTGPPDWLGGTQQPREKWRYNKTARSSANVSYHPSPSRRNIPPSHLERASAS